MKPQKKASFLILSGLIFAVAFFGILWFINARVDFLLNSDDSSELVLGHLLAAENSLLSKNWYYSTELRVVNTQIFYAFFFKIFQSWHSVRIASYVCLYICMVAAYYFACRGLGIRKYFLITAALLMIPFSEAFFSVVLKGAYYIPHIIITFFTLGLCENYVAEESNGRKALYLTAAFLCSILAGMGGPRQVVVLYIPLLFTAICIMISGTSVTNGKTICILASGNRKYILFSFTSFCGAIIGYVVNTKILSKFFVFQQWDISFTGFDISRLSQIINGFLSSYGYVPGKIFSIALLRNISCACWLILTVVACVHVLKNRKDAEPAHYRMAIFTVAAFLTFVLLYMFTNIAYVDRYNLPIIILSVPMIAILFKDTGLCRQINHTAITTFVLLIVCSGFSFCAERYEVDETAEFRNIVAALQNEQYTEGYASFWRANIVTELSNGSIDMRDWQDSGGEQHITVASIDDTYKWLQLVSHDYTRPEGKVFLLFTRNEWENNPWTGKLSTEHIIYQSNGYMVIGYESYDKLRYDTMQP